MKVYILGKNNDDKGSQLEELTRQILEQQGFTNIVKNTQHSGASEIDVRGEKQDTTGIKNIAIPVICECKAHNKPIDMNDWLKFIGKLYIERKKRTDFQNTIGLMISLSGANGCVQGSYRDDFSDDNRTQLIANEDLFSIIANLYSIRSLAEIKQNLLENHNLSCWGIDVAYFDKKCYIIVSLDESQYSICNSSGELIREENISDIISLIDTWTEFSREKYVDIWKKEETAQFLNMVESNLLTCLFTIGNITFEEAQKHIVYEENKAPLAKELLIESAFRSQYIDVNKDEKVFTLREINDVISFINHLYKMGMTQELFSSEKFQNMIDSTLLESIKIIQYGIELDEREKDNCLFLIKHSPSALSYAINSDKFLHSYKHTAWLNPELRNLLHNHFFRQLIKLFEEDFSNPLFSSLMRNSFSIADFHLKTTVILDDGKNKKDISMEQKLSLIPIQGFKYPMLISHILKSNSQ